MKNRVAKLLSIFLAIALLVGASPVRLAVYAEEDDQATETKTENAEGDNDKGSGEDKTPTPKAAPETQEDKTEADKSTPTPEPDDQKESQAPTTNGDKESDPDKTPTQEPQTTDKPEPEPGNGEGGETDISETTPAPETHKIPGKAGSTTGGYNLELDPNCSELAGRVYTNVTTFKLPSVERAGYHFYGWAESPDGAVKYREGQTITLTGNLTLYAIWDTEYLLTLNLNYEEATERKLYTNGKKVILPSANRSDYFFLGWAESANGEVEYYAGDEITLTSNLILYAIWDTETPYVLTLNLNYEGATERKLYTNGKKVKLPSANRSNFSFVGWAESSNGEVKYSAGQTITLTGNLTLYSIWGFTVTVKNGTGSGSYAEGASVTVTANTPETGNKFEGWACSDELTFTSGNATTSTATFIMPAYDVTLTAVFTDMMAHYYSLSPSEYTLNGSGYTDITCTLTSFKLGYAKISASEYVEVDGIGFYMNAGTLSDGNSHSISFLVDDRYHFGPEKRKDQGNYHVSQGETFVMSIYVDPNDYANAVPGTYTGTFTYDSEWSNGGPSIPGASGSIKLTLVVPKSGEHVVAVNNGTGSGSYAEGVSVTITANAPEAGKQFKEWAGTDGLKFTSGNATSPTVTFTMPDKNVVVTATYKDTEHTIKVNNGSADPAKATAGTVIKLTADAAPSGKVFDKWVVNAGSVPLSNVSSSTATFTMPDENVEVTATYKDVPAGSYVIKVNNGNGNTTSLISAPGLVVNVKASDAPAGTEFEKWEVVSGTVIFANASSAATIFVMPAENVEITARYKSSLSVKGKTATVKYSKVKKKNQTLAVSKVLTFVDKGQGKLTYAKVSGNSKILINKTTGTITVKKKLKKKTYTVKVKVMASGDNSCNPSGWKTVTFKIKVK